MANTAPTPEDRSSRLDALYDGFKKEFRDVPEVTVQVLAGWVAEANVDGNPPPVLVDVRTPEEQRVSVLSGRDTLTQRQFEERGPEAFRGRRVVCYCTAGYRSGLLARQARRKHGLETYNLRGGILAWTQAGYPLTDPRDGSPTARVHVFSKDWALQGEGYEPVVFQRPLVPLLRNAVVGFWQSSLRAVLRRGPRKQQQRQLQGGAEPSLEGPSSGKDASE